MLSSYSRDWRSPHWSYEAGYVFAIAANAALRQKLFSENRLTRGVLDGYPVDDVRIELYDGSYHDVDSSEMAFKIAGSMAFQDAAKKAQPVLLEPVMRVEVVVQKEHMGDVMDSLSSRRGAIQSQEDRGGSAVFSACVPLSEMFGYSTDLRERTQGRGTFAMRLERYQPCRPAEDSDGSRDSLVGAPLKPRPTHRASSIALPEPDEDGLGERPVLPAVIQKGTAYAV